MPSNDCCLAVIIVILKILNYMKTKFTAFLLSIFLTVPCVLRAEEVEIQLMEVIQMEMAVGD